MKLIYCNNLEQSEDRRKMMSGLFQKIGYSKEAFRFNAFLGTQIINNPTKLSPGKTGNLLSHMSIWNEISKKEDGFYMVMEDDLVLAENVDSKKFRENMEQMIKEIPANVGMIHCTRDISKIFIKQKLVSKLKPRYRVVAHFGDLEVKKCSPIYPWSTETGAYLIRPKTAGKLFRQAKWLVKYDKKLPFRNNVDILISRSLIANLSGAMVKLYQQNIDASVIDQVNNAGKSESNVQTNTITYDAGFFERSSDRISPWF